MEILNPRYKQGENETKFEHGLRLIEVKCEENPSDLDWQDIIDILQLNIHRDSLRKACNTTEFSAFNVMKYFKDKQVDNIMDDNIIKEIELKRVELEKEKIRFQDQKREYRNLIRIEARWEHLRNEIIKAVENLNKEKPMINKFTKQIVNGNNEASLILSDWHIGMEVENYWNKFNINIAKQRVAKLTNKTIEYCLDNKVKTLHIELLGDFVNGLIHTTTRINNEEDVISQVMICSEILANMINNLSSEIEFINVYSTWGNHGRVTANTKDNLEVENFERLIMWFLSARIQNENVKFVENEFDRELISYKVHGEYIFGLHGHHDKPLSVVDNWVKMLKVFPKEVHLGHWHKHFETEEYDMCVSINGCLSGTDDFAKEIRKTNSPFQKLIIYKEGEEDSCTYRIKL